MTYKNTKTGFVFSSPCELKGQDWVKLGPAPTLEEKEEKKPVKKRTKKDE